MRNLLTICGNGSEFRLVDWISRVATLDPSVPTVVVDTGDTHAFGTPPPTEDTEISNGFDAVRREVNSAIERFCDVHEKTPVVEYLPVFGNHDLWPDDLPVRHLFEWARRRQTISNVDGLSGPWPHSTPCLKVEHQDGDVAISFTRFNTASNFGWLTGGLLALGGLGPHPQDDESNVLAELRSHKCDAQIRLAVAHYPLNRIFRLVPPRRRGDRHCWWFERNAIARGLTAASIPLLVAGHTHETSARNYAGVWELTASPTLELISYLACKELHPKHGDKVVHKGRFTHYELRQTPNGTLEVDRFVLEGAGEGTPPSQQITRGIAVIEV